MKREAFVTYLKGSSGSPVLLLPGICSKSAAFLQPPTTNFASLLGQKHAVYLADLTQGRVGNATSGWDFDYHIRQDIPKILSELRVRWGVCHPVMIGHSMGGMLAMAAASMGLADVSKIVTIGSPFSFGNIPVFPPIMFFTYSAAKLIGLKTVPVKLLAKILVLFEIAARLRGDCAKLRIFHMLIMKAGIDVPTETLSQACLWVKSGRFYNRTGDVDYLDAFHRIQVPVLCIAGARDRIAPNESVHNGYEKIGCRVKQLKVIADADHLSLICGREMRECVTAIESWLGE